MANVVLNVWAKMPVQFQDLVVKAANTFWQGALMWALMSKDNLTDTKSLLAGATAAGMSAAKTAVMTQLNAWRRSKAEAAAVVEVEAEADVEAGPCEGC